MTERKPSDPKPDSLPPPAAPRPDAPGEPDFQSAATLPEGPAPVPASAAPPTEPDFQAAATIAEGIPCVPEDADKTLTEGPADPGAAAEPDQTLIDPSAGGPAAASPPASGAPAQGAASAPAKPIFGMPKTAPAGGSSSPGKSVAAALADLVSGTAKGPGSSAASATAPGKSASAVAQTRPSPASGGASGVQVSGIEGGSTPGAGTIERSRVGATSYGSRAAIDPATIENIRATGQQFGDYILVKKLGQGGMGAVFKGYEPKLNRYVAIKVLTATSGDQKMLLTRFMREARAAAKVRHSNIVSVFDIGTVGETPYMAMDYVEGESLDKFVRNPKDQRFPKGDRTVDGRPSGLETACALRLAIDICQAVDFAHKQGIIHRDIKPANVMIANDTSRPMLTDFGLAKDLSETESQRLTRSGLAMGTALYMAPEQALGDDRVGPLSDVYSLGATVYEMLTGRPPFEAGETMVLLSRVINDDCKRPSSIVRSLDPQLDVICMKALEKDPARRYATAGDLAEDLSRFSRGELILAQPPTLDYRVRRWVKRRRLPLGLGLLGVAALVVAGYFFRQSEWARRQMGDLETALTDKREAEDRHNRALAKLAEAQSAFQQMVVAARAGNAQALPAGLERVAGHVRETLRIEDLADAKVLEAAALRWAGKRTEARSALDALVTADPKLVQARFERGRGHLEEYAEKLAAARGAAFTAERLLARPPAPASEWTPAATWEKADPALAALRAKAVADFEAVSAWPEAPERLALAQALVLALRDGADRDQAATALKSAGEAVQSEEEPWWARAHLALERGDPAGAFAALTELANRNPAAVTARRDRLVAAVAGAMAAEGDAAEARLLEARAALDRLLEADPGFAAGPLVRGWTARRRFEAGRVPADQKIPLLQEALDSWKGVASQPSVELFRSDTWDDLADLHTVAGRHAESVAALRESIEALTRANPDGKDTALLERRATTLSALALGEVATAQDARATYRREIADRDALLASRPEDRAVERARGVAWHNLGQAMAAQKEDPTPAFEKGHADLTRCLERDPADKEARRMRIRCGAGLAARFNEPGKEAEKGKAAELMRADCEEALRSFPEDAELLRLLANAEGVLAFWFDLPQEQRSTHYVSAEAHYQQAVERGAKESWYNLGMLYLAKGLSDQSLQAFRRYRTVVPEENPELDKIMRGLEGNLQRQAAIKDLLAVHEVIQRQQYVDAEKAYEEAFVKFEGYLKLLRKEEVAQILKENLAQICVSHYNLGCVYAQASAGKGGKQQRPAVPKDQVAAYVELAFEELNKAAELGWGKRIGPDGKLVPDPRSIEQIKKDTDLAPLYKDPRWKSFLDRLSK